MIVDDEGDIRTTVRTILEKAGYKTITAVDGDDCLEKVKGQKVDLVILDIMMPGTPAKDVVGEIKNTKVMYLSVVRVSEAEKEDMLRARNIVGFVQKPFDVKDLLEKVKKIVG